jgi:hypothetical protein
MYTIIFPFFRGNKNQQDFWNGTLVDNYNFLMSEELIYHCKVSLINRMKKPQFPLEFSG